MFNKIINALKGEQAKKQKAHEDRVNMFYENITMMLKSHNAQLVEFGDVLVRLTIDYTNNSNKAVGNLFDRIASLETKLKKNDQDQSKNDQEQENKK